VHYFFERRSQKKILIYLGILPLYTAILLTGTRGILVALMLCIAFLYGMLLKRGIPRIIRSTWPRFLLLYFSIGIITLLYSIPIPLNRGTKASARVASSVEILRVPTTTDPGIRHRWLIWSVTATMIQDHPLSGIGYGTYQLSYASYETRFLQHSQRATRYRFEHPPPPPSHAENEYLHVWAETGLIGFGLFLALLLKLGLRILHILNSSPDTTFPLSLALSTALLSILIHSLVSYPLHMPVTALTFWAIIGWLMSSSNAESQNPNAK
jgi:O-antigen ligase